RPDRPRRTGGAPPGAPRLGRGGPHAGDPLVSPSSRAERSPMPHPAPLGSPHRRSARAPHSVSSLQVPAGHASLPGRRRHAPPRGRPASLPREAPVGAALGGRCRRLLAASLLPCFVIGVVA